jgi:hypothetical protein
VGFTCARDEAAPIVRSKPRRVAARPAEASVVFIGVVVLRRGRKKGASGQIVVRQVQALARAASGRNRQKKGRPENPAALEGKKCAGA